MKVVLLAGGQSSRVKPVADKCFVKICGRFLIEWQLESLLKAGFRDVVIVGNADNLERLKALSIEGADLQVVEQEDLSGGMKAAMDAAKPEVHEEDSILVVSSNDVVDSGCWSLVSGWIEKSEGTDGALVGYRVSEYFPGGYLEVDEQGVIHSIVEKPGAGNEPSDLVNLVIHVHKDVKALYEALDAVSSPTPDRLKGEKAPSDDLYEQAMQQLFSEQKKYSVIPYEGYWQPVKYPWHLLDLNEYFLKNLKRSISDDAQIAETAVINGEVVVEAGVRIFDHAVINGPAYIGKNGIVGNFALVRQSSLGDRCVAGSYTEIARSLLQDDVWTHKNYIGDSVIGSNVSFGSGTVTGNLRLDEGDISSVIKDERVSAGRTKLGVVTGDHIRVGVNTSFMPGIKVGSQTMIGSELNVNENIDGGMFVIQAADGKLDKRQNLKSIERR